jgi:hypothetical protein
MTTFTVHEDAGLAQALTDTIEHASPDAVVALSELRNAATPGNGSRTAHVPWGARLPVAASLRACADSGHPLGGRLRDLARALDDSLRAHAANNPGFPAPPPEPAVEPEPAEAAHAGY